MADYLAEAKRLAKYAFDASDLELAQSTAQLAIAHTAIALVESVDKATNALIAIAERLPLPAEPPSARSKRLRQEDKNGI